MKRLQAIIVMLCAIACSAMAQTSQTIKELQSMATAGDAKAQCNLGVLYYEGKELKRSYAEAVKWFRLAAKQGLASAERNLGICYGNGEGVRKSEAKAKELLKKAEAKGDITAARICQERGWTVLKPEDFLPN